LNVDYIWWGCLWLDFSFSILNEKQTLRFLFLDTA
jgi:hypothetical protein